MGERPMSAAPTKDLNKQAQQFAAIVTAGKQRDGYKAIALHTYRQNSGDPIY